MNSTQRLNAVSMLHVRHELETSYASGIVKYGLRPADADILLKMSDEDVITAAISTEEPVFTIRPMMQELQSHAAGSEYDLLLAVTRQHN